MYSCNSWNYTLIQVDCKMKKRKRKLQKVCCSPFLRNSRTSNSLTKGLNPISRFCRCWILPAPASGAILETSLRVGVIPSALHLDTFFCPCFSVYRNTSPNSPATIIWDITVYSQRVQKRNQTTLSFCSLCSLLYFDRSAVFCTKSHFNNCVRSVEKRTK